MHIRTPPFFHRSPISILTAATRPAPRINGFTRTLIPVGIGLGLSYTISPGPWSIRYDDSAVRPFSTSPSSSGRRNPGFSESSSGRGGGPLGLDSKTVRQITTGSILGVLGGFVFSMFSRTLAILIGLSIVGVQYLASKGVRLVPVEKLQRYVKGIDLKKLVETNPAMKISFGITFMLSAFGSF